MTTAPSEPPPKEPTAVEERSIVQTVSEILTAGLAVSATTSLLLAALKPLRIGLRAVQAAYASWRKARNGLLSDQQSSVNEYTAWFLLNSSKRIQRGLSQGDKLSDVLKSERRYLEQHFAAQVERAHARQAAKEAADVSYGFTGEYLFRWEYSKEMGPCKPIRGVLCKHLHGRVFQITHPPQGLYPGERHPFCKCRALPVMSSNYTGSKR